MTRAPMQAVILSAGIGSRLLPLTREIPKCLVEVGGRSILDHQLDALHAAGVAEATIVGGYRYRQIGAHLARSRPPLPVRLVFNPFWSVASSIGSVWMARDRLDAPFCLVNGDTVFAADLLAAAVRAPGEGTGLLVEPLAAPEPDDMLVTIANGQVCAVAKDLPYDVATHRSLGVIVSAGGDDYVRALESVIARPGGLDAFHHAVIAELAGYAPVRAIVAGEGAWQEIDRPDDIAAWTGRAR
ncbi:NTP transferase domain-containing protein [Sphingomonas sp. RP10(2022)]|uniref:NTP transferase domain-containing protein n=1 Tax=Sphingomonas liriopis TaxID=2949094 RepID=A0A9X2HX22_9SPHN|nr:NTP transferase domain-containing protein [Sphingomonas liriopis]MCP3734375.1 NTP transferase domain-containing protein [Sphingomonas liriopis]